MKRFSDSWVRRHPVVALLLFIPWLAIWLSFAGFRLTSVIFVAVRLRLSR